LHITILARPPAMESWLPQSSHLLCISPVRLAGATAAPNEAPCFQVPIILTRARQGVEVQDTRPLIINLPDVSPDVALQFSYISHFRLSDLKSTRHDSDEKNPELGDEQRNQPVVDAPMLPADPVHVVIPTLAAVVPQQPAAGFDPWVDVFLPYLPDDISFSSTCAHVTSSGHHACFVDFKDSDCCYKFCHAQRCAGANLTMVKMNIHPRLVSQSTGAQYEPLCNTR